MRYYKNKKDFKLNADAVATMQYRYILHWLGTTTGLRSSHCDAKQFRNPVDKFRSTNFHLKKKTYNSDYNNVINIWKGKNLVYDGVSAWRNYFIANEWLKLTTKRKSSIFVQVVLFLCTFMVTWDDIQMIICKEFHAKCDWYFQFLFDLDCSGILPSKPHCRNHSADRTLKLATGMLIYVGVYVAQRIVAVLREKYVKNSIQQFVDICSIANVSVFTWLFESYGFYVHGRSPHGFSDTDMCSMMLQLRRAESNLCGRRGLMLTSEQQTYSFLVPRNVRFARRIRLWIIFNFNEIIFCF